MGSGQQRSDRPTREKGENMEPMSTYENSSFVEEFAARGEWEFAAKDARYFNLTGRTGGEALFEKNFSGVAPQEQTIPGKSQDGVFESGIIVPLYAVIFILSVIGNSLVLATLGQNKRMRTVTNVYLLNLAVSDLLLGVFCMPFTLVGQVLRNFIFGASMCKMIPYFQAVSVSVGVWTLVVISLERYFAICRPLKSRQWQTQFHAYKMITLVWLCSLAWTSPILLVSRLKALKMGRHKCREEWPNPTSERVFNMFLDVVLLLVPLVIMTLAYSLIVSKLWKGLRHEIKHSTSCAARQERCDSTATVNGIVLNRNERDKRHPNSACGSSKALLIRVESSRGRNGLPLQSLGRRTSGMKLWLKKINTPNRKGREDTLTSVAADASVTTAPPTRTNEENSQIEEVSFIEGAAHKESVSYTFTRHAIRSNYMDKSIEAKRKVIRMLFVVVAEFFICWAPLHILNTWYLFSPEAVYQYVGSTGVSLVQLLAYISSCCNPITYCFMNRKFRQSFLNVFSCWKYCNNSEDGKEGVRRSCNLAAAPNRSETSVTISFCSGPRYEIK